MNNRNAPSTHPAAPRGRGVPVWGWTLIGTGVFVLALCGIGIVGAAAGSVAQTSATGVLIEVAATAAPTTPVATTSRPPESVPPAPSPSATSPAPTTQAPAPTAAAPSPTPARTTATRRTEAPPATQAGTVSQQNAVRKAKSYLSHSAFSRSGLIHQLEYEGFSIADASYAVDRVDADWNEQAAKKAKSYLSHSAFSRSGLIHQLEYEGFTSAQAVYGVNSVGL